ncbi:MAG: PIG-L family deacetylase [Nocardioides sp.]
MMTDTRSGSESRLLAVHAHPDDESITTGGLLARCSRSGVSTRLVTCTDGRYGPVNPDLGLKLLPDALADLRASELAAAADVLGIGRVDRLGYHDSGMLGSPHNQAPAAFWSQPIDVLVGQLVGVLRAFRPHVVISYDPFGCTGHSDHIHAHRVTMLGVAAAGESHVFAELGPAWEIGRVFYPVFPRSALDRFVKEDLRAGLPHPFDGRDATTVNYVRPDATVTHVVDIAAVHDVKTAALHSHRTQVGPHYPKLYRAALARRDYEHFRLAYSHSGRDWPPALAEVFEPVDP